MRTLDPFGFFFEHASAIAGYGGEVASPDVRYCFHTHYEAVRPGPAQFHLKLAGAKASRGELMLRVHGFRGDGTHDAVLVAGSRLDFELPMTEDIELDVRFRAVQGVNYAFYGLFSEPSDLTVASFVITLEELDEEGDGRSVEEDVAVSILAAGAVGTSASQASALVLGRHADLTVPVSQDCTWRQLRSREFDAFASPAGGDVLQQWGEIMCRQALIAYGATLAGLRGLMIGGRSPLLSAFSADRGMALDEIDWQLEQGEDALAVNGPVDFLVSFLDIAAIDKPEARYEALVTLLSRLLVGGLGLFCFRYTPHAELQSGTAIGKVQGLTRNEIGQWVLRLIGTEFSAAPLAFAPLAELVRDEAGRTAIVLVLRRL